MMDNNSNTDYLIPLKGLGSGKHRYEFDVALAFFKTFENEQIEGARLKVEVDSEKGTGATALDVSITGEIDIACDRCLEILTLPVEIYQKLTVRFEDNIEERAEESDDIIIVDRGDIELDLSQIIYDYVYLAIPIVNYHPEGECNEDVIAKINRAEENTGSKPFEGLKDLIK